MPGCIVSATTASFRSVEKRRRRATPVMTSTFENVSDIGVCLGLYLGPPAKAGVRSKRGAVHGSMGACAEQRITSIVKTVSQSGDPGRFSSSIRRVVSRRLLTQDEKIQNLRPTGRT